MLRFLAGRFALMVFTVWITVTLGFFINRLAPGSAFDRERPLPPEVKANLEAKYGLDKPLLIQYFKYMKGVACFDFGESFVYEGQAVTKLIGESFPVSLALGSMSLLLALLFGSALGIISAIKRNGVIDYLFSSLSIAGISLPVFVVGPVLMFVFAITFDIFPTSGWIDENPLSAFLPVVALSIPYSAVIARLSRSSMIDVLRSDYIRTARAKGLPPVRVIVRHGLKGAMLPVVSYLGPAIAGIITGSLVIEQIFRIPGLGRPFVQSVLNRDYLLTMGCVIVYGVVLISMNTVVDILYRVLDPRVRRLK